MTRLRPLMLILYALVPFAAYFVVSASDKALDIVLRDTALASIPMVLLAIFTWRLVWPRWKLIGKLLLHPCIYAMLAVYIGAWAIAVGWVHQGLLGLGGHIWFSHKHGFTWYAVEDPERYIATSKQMVAGLSGAAGGHNESS